MQLKEGIHDVPIKTSLHITNQNGRPCLEVRRSVSDFETIKKLLHSAFNKQVVNILPTFTNEIQAISKLQERGLIHKDEKGEWKYTF